MLRRGFAHSDTSICTGILSYARDGERVPAAQVLMGAPRMEQRWSLSSLFPSVLLCCEDKP